ncbi:chitin synthase-domain-containing protein [Gongronella butleri]|nr:chitin synthase-domain-containing protein [Gongronella butleri]
MDSSNLERNLSTSSRVSRQTSQTGNAPRRQRSLVRPERERIDARHRQYHYRQRTINRGQTQQNVAPSTTGNQPFLQQSPPQSPPQGFQQLHQQPQGYQQHPQAYVQQQQHQQQQEFVAYRTQRDQHAPHATDPLPAPPPPPGQAPLTHAQPPPPPPPPQHFHQRQPPPPPPPSSKKTSLRRKISQRLERRPTNRQVFLRRGKSILARDKNTNVHDDDQDDIHAGAIDLSKPLTFWEKMPDPWWVYCRVLTCCIPGAILSVFGMSTYPAQRAWREKIGLLSFILGIMGFVGFLTFGFTQAVCPTPALSIEGGHVNNGYLIINGWAYLLAEWEHPATAGMNKSNILYPPIDAGGQDASFLFQKRTPECDQVFTAKAAGSAQVYFPCRLFNPNATLVPDASTFTNTSGCHTSSTARSLFTQFTNDGVPTAKGLTKAARVFYGWDNISDSDKLVVYNGDIWNVGLLKSLPTSVWNVPANGLIAQIQANPTNFIGKDISHMISSTRSPATSLELEAKCLSQTIKVGSLDTLSIGCISSDIVLYVSLVVILGVIGIRFGLAVIFGWFLSWKLGHFNEGTSYKARMKRQKEIDDWAANMQLSGPLSKARVQSMYFGNNQNKRKSLFPQTSRFTQSRGVSMHFGNGSLPSPHAWRSPSSTLEGMASRQSQYFGSSTASFRLGEGSPRRSSISSDFNSGDSSASGSTACPYPLSPHVLRQPPASYMPFKFPLAHTICLVTCYSEGEEGLRTTLDSIATSDYPNSHKLIFVICDGVITGSGNAQSTPDICVGMMRNLIVPEHLVQPTHYLAIADGSKRNNMAKVYAGYYKYDDNTVNPTHQQRVPMITIVKCGMPEEATLAKPGNRGKRDSQILLMQFMQKVMFDERMTTMEYDLFNSMWRITGVTPDVYEICLMVDADTKLFPDALTRMVGCAVKDPEIIGMCGETKIANKTNSWVTMIQVFEYYISHHQSKAFESVFGICTCLPGCFCMYRIKAPKGPDGYWVPILANPDIVEHYSENVVDTLHKKNLLLLGEDRYLSTLMLRTFPNRKMMFVPQAVCKTVVPDTFAVLLSQRRRWINSTIHNLMELLFVHDLCGTFCFSMQFVVFMELVGTLALPAAISFTLYLVVMACLGQPAILPLILLALILGLPAVLIVMTSRKLVYIGWMVIYLFSLPIWNFVLPVYAYWHFDDFSWGETRKVEGEGKEKGHGDKEGEFDSSIITMKKWSDYEKERRVRMAMERNLPPPRFMERPRSTMDIFKDFPQTRKANSAGSNDSDTPFATHDALNAENTQTPDTITSAHDPSYDSYQQDRPQSPRAMTETRPGTSSETAATTSPPSDIPLRTLPQKSTYHPSKSVSSASAAPTSPVSPSSAAHGRWQSTSTWADPAPHH